MNTYIAMLAAKSETIAIDSISESELLYHDDELRRDYHASKNENPTKPFAACVSEDINNKQYFIRFVAYADSQEQAISLIKTYVKYCELY